VTTLPDWLVERAALDEVGAASRDRLAKADATELAARVAAIREANAAELAAYPASVAVAQITDRARIESRRRSARRRRWLGMLSAATVTLTALLVVFAVRKHPPSAIEPPPILPVVDDTRAKGIAHLTAYRQAGDHAEHLDDDAVVHEGDTVQLRYTASGQHYGLIASIDGAGGVTLHYPTAEDAPATATALATKPTSLASAYVLDDAPRFERFFFITSADPIDVGHTLAALRTFAARNDSDTAALELPESQHQWSLRLRKPTP
jgi:hypothetical protein